MTEKERRERFNDPYRWVVSNEFPSNQLLRVMCFQFYDLMIYDLQIYRYKYEGIVNGQPKVKPGWQSRMYFKKSFSKECLEEVSKTECYRLLKEEDQKWQR